MTEMANGEVSAQSSTSIPVNTSSTPSQASTDERTFRQSEVNDIVGRAKQEAIERYQRETSRSAHQPNPQYNQSQNYSAGQSYQQTSFNGLSEDEYRRIAAEEFQRSRDEWVAQAQREADQQSAMRDAREFLTKIEAGKQKYEDFEQKVTQVGFGHFPDVVRLANMVENTDEVVYELANNPTKIAEIQTLVNMQPQLAVQAIQNLSNSIKLNQKAQNFKSPNEPLSQLKPGNAGTDNGELRASDYRRLFRA